MHTTIPGLFVGFVDRNPEAVAVRWHDGTTWQSMTRSESLTEVSRLTRTLHDELGVTTGTPIAILSDTRREWAAIDMAAQCLRAIVVGIYPTLRPEQVEYQLAHSEAKICVVENAAQAAKVLACRDRLPNLEHLISIDPTEGIPSIHDFGGVPDVPWLRERAAEAQPDDVATYIYTSGTTGDPKGAVLTHHNFVATAHASKDIGGLEPGEHALIFLPLAHSFQRFTSYRGFLEEGVGWYVPSINQLPWAIQEARPHVLATVPRMLEKIKAKADAAVHSRGGFPAKMYTWAFKVGRRRAELEVAGRPIPAMLRLQDRIAERVFQRVRERLGGNLRLLVSGGAALNPEVSWWFMAMRVTVLEGWGLTETSAPATANAPGYIRVGTVGRAIDGIELRLDDDGEVLVRGAGVFKGYYKDEAATAATFDGDWFRTGDIGEIDAEGYLKIVDRKKEILVTAGGKNIPPVNIENRIERSPYVEKAIAIGDGRPYIAALLVPDTEALDSLAEKYGWPTEDLATRVDRPEVKELFDTAVKDANETLARYEQVKRFDVLPREFTPESGELTATMKLKRRVIRERYAPEIASLYA